MQQNSPSGIEAGTLPLCDAPEPFVYQDAPFFFFFFLIVQLITLKTEITSPFPIPQVYSENGASVPALCNLDESVQSPIRSLLSYVIENFFLLFPWMSDSTL